MQSFSLNLSLTTKCGERQKYRSPHTGFSLVFLKREWARDLCSGTSFVDNQERTCLPLLCGGIKTYTSACLKVEHYIREDTRDSPQRHTTWHTQLLIVNAICYFAHRKTTWELQEGRFTIRCNLSLLEQLMTSTDDCNGLFLDHLMISTNGCNGSLMEQLMISTNGSYDITSGTVHDFNNGQQEGLTETFIVQKTESKMFPREVRICDKLQGGGVGVNVEISCCPTSPWYW